MFKKIAIAATMLAMSTPAIAQSPNCFERSVALERLESMYGEHLYFSGLASNNMLVETIVNQETGTWSLIITRPDGISCMGAEGTNFNVFPEPEVIEGEPM